MNSRSNTSRSLIERLSDILKRFILIEKFGYWGLFFLLVLFSVFTAFLLFKFKLLGAIAIAALVIGLPILVGVIFNLQFGVITVFLISFFMLGVLRFIDAPLGLVLDVLMASMFFGVILLQVKQKNWGITKNLITYFVLIWLSYCFLQVLNPYAASKLAWLYTIRSNALFMLLYFVALFAFSNLKFFKVFYITWIALALLAGIYGLYQEFVGLHPAELKWVTADPERHKLFFNWGRFRKFSIFSNPTIFGVLMAHSSLLCFVLATGKISNLKKVLLLLAGFIMVWSMIYSGTRTAIAMLPAGLLFFVVLTFKKSTIAIATVFLLFGAFIVLSPINSFGPLNRNSLERIRSTFKFEDDPSFQVRLKNQAYIKPFIITHPFGAGLGSVGQWGRRFSPNSPLSQFPPDSGFVRIAVELGWVGLILYGGLLFSIFYTGIKGYFQVHNPRIKLYYTAILTVVYALVVANYAQEAILMIPTMVIFYVLMAQIAVLKSLDKP